MSKRILIVSNLNSQKPYGNFTRPFYIGQELSKIADVMHIGYDCSSVTYAPSISTGSSSVIKYVRTILDCVAAFKPHIVYSHENRPSISALIASKFDKLNCVFDFHASPAHEYEMNRMPLKRIIAKFIENRLVRSNFPIVVASEYVKNVIQEAYACLDRKEMFIAPNGVPERMLQEQVSKETPYKDISSKYIALLIAPRYYPSNVESVKFAIEVAHQLINENIKFIVLGGGDEIPGPLNFEYVGHVDDIIPYIDFSDICLCPFPQNAVTGGARNKVFDFFSRKKIVISTPEGLSGITGVSHLHNAFISGYDPAKFALDLEYVLKNKHDFSHLGEQALLLVINKYNWRAAASKVYGIFESIAR